jgi:uncharacterized protein (TIGR02147 family)
VASCGSGDSEKPYLSGFSFDLQFVNTLLSKHLTFIYRPTIQVFMKEISPAQILRTVFSNKMLKNPSYSLRAFARDVGVSPSYLSQILNNRRKVPLSRASDFIDKLQMTYPHDFEFLQAIIRESSNGKNLNFKIDNANLSTFRSALEDQYSVLKKWYHLAILNIFDCQPKPKSKKEIAKKLGLSLYQVEESLTLLTSLDLAKQTSKGFERTHRRLDFKTSKSRSAVREYHLQMIEKAKNELEKKTDETSFQQREVSGMTMSINTKHIKEAQKRIDLFKKEMSKLLCQESCDEVYQLNVQLFPLSASPQKSNGRSRTKARTTTRSQ